MSAAASTSRPQRKRKKIDYAEASYNWSEQQQLVKALTLSLKNEEAEEKPQQQNKSQPKKSATTTKTCRRKGNEAEVPDEPQNCMVRLTRLQKMLHDTLVRDGTPDKKQTEKSSIKQEAEVEGNDNEDDDDKNATDVAVSKYRAQRKFAPNCADVSSTKPPQRRSRANQKKPKVYMTAAPKTRPKNIICEKSPDTTTFLDYLCYRGTEFEPDLDA